MLITRIWRYLSLRRLLCRRSLCLTRSGCIGATAAASILLGGQLGCLMFSQSLFELCRRFEFWFLRTVGGWCTGGKVSRCSASFCLSLVEVRQHSLVVLLYCFIGYSFHAKDFDVEAGTVWEGVFDSREILFVNLIHMHIETWCVSACSYKTRI